MPVERLLLARASVFSPKAGRVRYNCRTVRLAQPVDERDEDPLFTHYFPSSCLPAPKRSRPPHRTLQPGCPRHNVHCRHRAHSRRERLRERRWQPEDDGFGRSHDTQRGGRVVARNVYGSVGGRSVSSFYTTNRHVQPIGPNMWWRVWLTVGTKMNVFVLFSCFGVRSALPLMGIFRAFRLVLSFRGTLPHDETE